MRIAIVGQKDFGKAVLEAFVARGDTVVGVFCATEKPEEAPDPLAVHAHSLGIGVHRLPSLRSAEARQLLAGLQPQLAVLAYVLQFVPQGFANLPTHGTIQYHPSLLPRYRGPSAINWPLILGDTQTGLSVFRPTDGLDEGPVILQKTVPIGADDTTGSVYFERLFPQGVAALVEAAEAVVNGTARELVQDESLASYQGWCRTAEAQIHWHSHVDQIYNLIRGCNPAPGAWTSWAGKPLQLYETRKHVARTLSASRGAIGAGLQPRIRL
jgi:methionyl-tRNA formyltransferase